jgi:class 3 adenylate cyclase
VVRLSREISQPGLVARVGIHSGPAFVGKELGREADVFGQVPAIAERVQALAEAGTVVVSDSTHRLISGLFVVEDLGARVPKGLRAPIKLFRLLEPSGVRGRIRRRREGSPGWSAVKTSRVCCGSDGNGRVRARGSSCI